MEPTGTKERSPRTSLEIHLTFLCVKLTLTLILSEFKSTISSDTIGFLESATRFFLDSELLPNHGKFGCDDRLKP